MGDHLREQLRLTRLEIFKLIESGANVSDGSGEWLALRFLAPLAERFIQLLRVVNQPRRTFK